MNQDPTCIFCKILRGEIPSARVLVTDHAIAFLDINPVNKGHLLLVPREHHPDLPSLPNDLSAHLGKLLPRLCRAVLAATQAHGLNVITNVGPVAGQTINHLHWHVIPRHQNDAVHWPWPHDSYPPDTLATYQQNLIAALESDQ